MTNRKDYDSMPDENKESASSRPAVEPPRPEWLTMTPEREATLIGLGFRRNRRRFRAGHAVCEIGEGWIRPAAKGWGPSAKGWDQMTNTMALAILHRLETKETGEPTTTTNMNHDIYKTMNSIKEANNGLDD